MQKILFVTYDFPFPLTSGGKSRAYHLLKFAKTKQNVIYLYSFVRQDPSKDDATELEKIGVKEIFTAARRRPQKHTLIKGALLSSDSVFRKLYFDKKVQKEMLRICEEKKIDIIQFESFYTTFFTSSEFTKRTIKQIYGSENIEHLLYFDLSKYSKNPLKKMAYASQARKIKKEEIHAYKNTDVTLVVREDEAQIAKDLGASHAVVIPNGIDVQFFKYKNSHAKKIKKLLFVGNFSYFPNLDAMNTFFSDIYPNLPGDMTITILGKGQETVGSIPKKNKRVKSIEYIPDIRDLYYSHDAFIFPVRIGGGTNFKILEAAACGLPIIAFPDKVESLGMRNKKHYLSFNTSEEFTEAVGLLENNTTLIHNLTENARELVEKEYSWRQIGKKLARTWENL